jgi:hypothetical protein
VGTQDPGCPLVGPISDVPVAGACTGNPHGVAQTAPLELVGEHFLGHRRTADIAGTDECDV